MKIQKALMRLVYYYPFYVVVLGVIFVIIVLLCSGAKAQSFKNGSFENNNASGCLLGTSYQIQPAMKYIFQNKFNQFL